MTRTILFTLIFAACLWLILLELIGLFFTSAIAAALVCAGGLILASERKTGRADRG